MRVFISIELPKNVRKEIEKIQEKLPKFIGKKTESENLHLTLKFLGEIDDGKIEKVKEKLKGISFPCFEVEIDEIGVFSEEFVRIIWLRLGGDIVFELQKKIDEVLDGFFEKEKRFMNHLTIARVKNVDNKGKFLESLKKIEVPNTKFIVDKFYLRESRLFPKGPEYSVIEEFDLIDKEN